MFRRPEKEILCSETSKWSAMFKSPQNGLLTLKYFRRGFLCLEDLRRVFYVQKTSEGSSMFGRAQTGLLCLDDLGGKFCLQRPHKEILCLLCSGDIRRVFQASEGSGMFRRPHKGLLWLEDLRGVFHVFKTDSFQKTSEGYSMTA